MANKKSPAHFAEQAEECWKLSLGNYSTREIAEKLGLSQTLVVRRLKLYQDTQVIPKAEEYRNRQMARIEIGIRALWPRYLQGDDKAMASMTRLLEREAKLLGLDSATLFKVETEVNDKYTDKMVALRLLGEMIEKRGGDTTKIDKQIAEVEQAQADGRPVSRPKRPVPQWYSDKQAREEAHRQAAKNRPHDEFANDKTFIPHEVQPEEIRIAEDIEEPAPRPRRRGKPVPNPAEQFLRDSDD
ncbi:hypothetical protein ACKI1I_35755 [Streptomyces turgidiscabies]|uniref:hypothetical protein n=1 Tax=Streptomyces turgidiscabies TaxID=85558 RepID=UPI0038F679A6